MSSQNNEVEVSIFIDPAEVTSDAMACLRRHFSFLPRFRCWSYWAYKP